MATQREALNQLLGRDVATPFRVDFIPEQDASDLTLDSARQEALANRPENRQARLKEKQAEYDRRLAKAEYIPDLSLSVRYQGISNVQVLPQNVATAGFLLTWEPFDWGRRHNKVRRGKQHYRTGSQRYSRDRIADRCRSRREIPQMAGSLFAA